MMILACSTSRLPKYVSVSGIVNVMSLVRTTAASLFILGYMECIVVAQWAW